MRRVAFLAATIAMLAIAPTASAAPPEDQVTILEFGGEVDCDGLLLTFETTGWVNGKSDGGFFYHLTWMFSNADGASWTYIDTGRVRFFKRGGVLYGSLSGRSVNVGPDQSSWIGHWVINTDTGDEARVGRGLGYIEDLACTMLA